MSNADIYKISTTFLSMGLFLFPLFVTPPTPRLLPSIKLFHRGNGLLAYGRHSLRQNMGQRIGQRLWLRHDV